jgi:hypothetical protein
MSRSDLAKFGLALSADLDVLQPVHGVPPSTTVLR